MGQNGGKMKMMKDKWNVITWMLLLTGLFGLLLASCKKETPVDELPIKQEEPDEGKEPEQPEESTKAEVTLYLPNETADGFLTSSMILEDTPEAIIAQLVADQALPEGVTVKSFDQKKGILDLSKEYTDGLQNTGTAGELLLIGCVVNTFLEHYGMKELLLYADGEIIETGHNTYDEAIRFVELE